METIFRVQDGEGYGPYGANFKHTGITSSDWARESDLYHENKPCPNEDGINNFPGGWLCAFASTTDLFNWFSVDEIESLHALGFRIWEIEISSSGECGESTYEMGMQQMLFDPYEINHQELWEG